MAFIQPLGQLRSPVSTYANLPLTGNVQGDLRICIDTGDAYTWMLEASSGSLTDWNKVTTASYSDLIGAPYSTALDIDNAVKVVTGLSINIALLAFNTLTGYWSSLAKMFDGVINQFTAEDSGLEVDDCENQTYVNIQENVYGGFYLPNKGDLDIYTRMLIHGDGIQGSTSFVDLLKQPLTSSNAIVDLVTKKFGTGSIKFNGTTSSLAISDASGILMGKYMKSEFYAEPMCLDFWFYSLASGLQPILANIAYDDGYGKSYDAGEYLSIQRLANGHVYANVIVTTDMGMTDTLVEVESASTVSDNAWHHIAIQKVDGYLQIWIDGSLNATSVEHVESENSACQALIKFGQLDTAFLNGHLDEIRLSNTERYTTTFTPMTKAYNTATTPAPTPEILDESDSEHEITVEGNARMSGYNPLFGNASLYLDGIDSYLTLADSDDWELSKDLGAGPIDSYTKFLLHCDGTNGSTTFTDEIGKTVTPHSGICLSTAQQKFGTAATLFHGLTSGDYLSIPDSDDFNFGSGDFTIDTWVYRIADCRGAIIDHYQDNNNRMHMAFFGDPGSGPVGLYLYIVSGGTQLLYMDVADAGITVGQWHHVALVRYGNLWSVYVDGVSVLSTTSSITYPNFSGDVHIGTYFYNSVPAPDRFFNGYMDEYRVSKGIARWTSSFTPPSAAYSYEYTKLLLHCDGTNNSTTFTDECGKTVTANGTAKLSTTSPKFGTASALFDGSTNCYLSIGDSDDWNFGTGDFTVDFWAKLTESSRHTFFRLGDYYSIDVTMYVVPSPDNAIALSINGHDHLFSYVQNPGTWEHFALVRTGTTLKVFNNGVALTCTYGGTSSDNITGSTSGAVIGWGVGTNTNYLLKGYIDEFRVSKGIARFGTFISPSFEYSFDDNTKLLLHCNGNNNSTTFTDECGKTVTPHGDAKLSTAQKKFGTASGVFDGSGDYLFLVDSEDWDFGSGNFTIDCWIRLNSIPDDIDFCSHRQDETHRWYFGYQKNAQKLIFFNEGTNLNVNASTGGALNIDTWYHLAVVRANGIINFYLNGTQLTNGTNINASSSINNNSGLLYIGYYGEYDYAYISGYIDELRISKGIARWTSTFTPLTSAYNSQILSDYTVDLWIDPLSLTDLDTYIIGVEDSWKLTLDGTSNKYLKYSVIGGNSIIAPIPLSLEQWHHVAIVQKDAGIKLYVNGILGASTAGSVTVNTSTILSIGASSTGTHLFNGFIEEVRISDNARWSAAFTPPEVAYDSDSNTKLLIPLNVQTVPNMVLQSVGYVANYVPTSARVVIFEEDIDVMEPNVDLKIEISRDGGTTFTACVIAKDQEFGDGTLNLFTGSINLDAQPHGELLVWKLTTQNNKDCRIRGISLNWR